MHVFFNLYNAGISLLVWSLIVSGLHAPLCEATPHHPREAAFPSGPETNPTEGNGRAPAAVAVVSESVGTAWPMACGYLVTNNHVVSDAESITLIDRAGTAFIAWPVLQDEMHDIAFLEVADEKALPPALPLAGSPTDLDTRVFTVGFPAEEQSVQGPRRSQGRICGLQGTGADDASYRTSVSVRHGNSGGPLMNLTGEVVGVVRSMLAYRDAASEQVHVLENASCAVKVDAVKSLLQFLPQKKPALRPMADTAGDTEALYDAVSDSVLRVVARRWESAPVD
ncbi:S1 family peptidase [Desulfosarcina alkanivorans]|jgi:S1-C subfamily serine protease|nr:serine protease [Desulfosarcina alkanivorans]